MYVTGATNTTLTQNFCPLRESFLFILLMKPSLHRLGLNIEAVIVAMIDDIIKSIPYS